MCDRREPDCACTQAVMDNAPLSACADVGTSDNDAERIAHDQRELYLRALHRRNAAGCTVARTATRGCGEHIERLNPQAPPSNVAASYAPPPSASSWSTWGWGASVPPLTSASASASGSASASASTAQISTSVSSGSPGLSSAPFACFAAGPTMLQNPYMFASPPTRAAMPMPYPEASVQVNRGESSTATLPTILPAHAVSPFLFSYGIPMHPSTTQLPFVVHPTFGGVHWGYTPSMLGVSQNAAAVQNPLFMRDYYMRPTSIPVQAPPPPVVPSPGQYTLHWSSHGVPERNVAQSHAQAPPAPESRLDWSNHHAIYPTFYPVFYPRFGSSVNTPGHFAHDHNIAAVSTATVTMAAAAVSASTETVAADTVTTTGVAVATMDSASPTTESADPVVAANTSVPATATPATAMQVAPPATQPATPPTTPTATRPATPTAMTSSAARPRTRSHTKTRRRELCSGQHAAHAAHSRSSRTRSVGDPAHRMLANMPHDSSPFVSQMETYLRGCGGCAGGGAGSRNREIRLHMRKRSVPSDATSASSVFVSPRQVESGTEDTVPVHHSPSAARSETLSRRCAVAPSATSTLGDAVADHRVEEDGDDAGEGSDRGDDGIELCRDGNDGDVSSGDDSQVRAQLSGIRRHGRQNVDAASIDSNPHCIMHLDVLAPKRRRVVPQRFATLQAVAGLAWRDLPPDIQIQRQRCEKGTQLLLKPVNAPMSQTPTATVSAMGNMESSAYVVRGARPTLWTDPCGAQIQMMTLRRGGGNRSKSPFGVDENQVEALCASIDPAREGTAASTFAMCSIAFDTSAAVPLTHIELFMAPEPFLFGVITGRVTRRRNFAVVAHRAFNVTTYWEVDITNADTCRLITNAAILPPVVRCAKRIAGVPGMLTMDQVIARRLRPSEDMRLAFIDEGCAVMRFSHLAKRQRARGKAMAFLR